jgi:iron complex outermembrane receptor protein
LIGATHPDNPFPGTANRLAYQVTNEIGPDSSHSDGKSFRALAGLKGTFSAWDYDTAVYYSESRQTGHRGEAHQHQVMDALLNPTAANVAAATAASAAYAALPAGTVWRIGENANLNTAAMYNALLSDQSREGYHQAVRGRHQGQSRIRPASGGPMGVAFGAEVRHEANNLPLYDGLGQYIGLSLTSYTGKRNIYATYAELLAPVLKTVELNGALRYDHYSDAGSSLTPKVGAKWKALPNLALRGTTRKASGRLPRLKTARTRGLLSAVPRSTTPRAAPAPASPLPLHGREPDLRAKRQSQPGAGEVQERHLGRRVGHHSQSQRCAGLLADQAHGLPVLEDTQAAIDAGHYTRDPASATTPMTRAVS